MPQPPATDLGRIASLFAETPGPRPAGAEGAAVAGGADGELPALPDRRRAPRRRLRDRIASLDGAGSPRLRSHPVLKDLVVLAEDDLRQSAIALGRIEGYLAESLSLLDEPDLDAAELADHARSDELLDHLEALGDSLAALRRRLSSLAAAAPKK